MPAHKLTTRQWWKLYQKEWRPLIDDLSSEERRKLRRGCQHKIGYDVYEEAIFALSQVVTTTVDSDNLSIYRCQLCSFFHLGNYRKRSIKVQQDLAAAIKNVDSYSVVRYRTRERFRSADDREELEQQEKLRWILFICHLVRAHTSCGNS